MHLKKLMLSSLISCNYLRSGALTETFPEELEIPWYLQTGCTVICVVFNPSDCQYPLYHKTQQEEHFFNFKFSSICVLKLAEVKLVLVNLTHRQTWPKSQSGEKERDSSENKSTLAVQDP